MCWAWIISLPRVTAWWRHQRKHFPRYWPFVRGIHRSPVNSPHKGQWRGALMFSLICAWINCWANNRKAGGLRRHRAHYDVTVMGLAGIMNIILVETVSTTDRCQPWRLTNSTPLAYNESVKCCRPTGYIRNCLLDNFNAASDNAIVTIFTVPIIINTLHY